MARPPGVPEDYEGRTGARAALSIAPGADDHVVDTVTVDVPGSRDGAAGIVASVLALDLEAAMAGGDVVEIDDARECHDTLPSPLELVGIVEANAPSVHCIDLDQTDPGNRVGRMPFRQPRASVERENLSPSSFGSSAKLTVRRVLASRWPRIGPT